MDEIIFVPTWKWIWWDVENSQVANFALTGTHPPVQYRCIQVQDTKLHAQDLGNIKTKFDTRWEGLVSYTKIWEECDICHKKFNETGYV